VLLILLCYDVVECFLRATAESGRWALFLVNDMAFGFPARFTESRTFHLREDELIPVVKSALAELGWPYKVLWGKDFQAWPRHGPWTWGEELKVRILRGGVMEVESKSVGYVPALFDFGRNRRNVEAFFAQVEQRTGERWSYDEF
jgi:hypothetical protein